MKVMRSDPVEALYHATTTPQLVVVPRLDYWCVDGHGSPEDPAYAAAIQALYTVAYGAKFALKKAGGAEVRISPLEGLWWAEDLTAFSAADKSAWRWRALLRKPDAVDVELSHRVAEEAARKKGLPAVRDVRVLTWEEGPAAQVLHVGPYAAEGPTIARLHEFLHDAGLDFDGRVQRHHEIYLGDPRRAAPERLRTIIRQPYRT